MLSVEQWPELHDPVMVVALSGWIDAGLAGSGAIAVLADQLEDAVIPSVARIVAEVRKGLESRRAA